MVGIVACSGEELPEGTVTRLAALEVLHQLRPAETVTICLPLFLAGGEGDRAFARYYRTVTVDGCPVRCAARATEMFSAPPAASIGVSELASELGGAPIAGRRRLNEAGQRAVAVTAARLASLVDEVLAARRGVPAGPAVAAAPAPAPAAPASPQKAAPTCSCGSGIPVQTLVIGGERVAVVALPAILAQLRAAGRLPDEDLGRELLEAVKVYNAVPREHEAAWSAALLAAYAAFAAAESP